MSEGTQRRLAAIVSADVVGYSLMMGADEVGTHARLQARFAELVKPRIAQHSGRIVKLMGDGLLAEFASVVDAVDWAVSVQTEVARLDAGEAAEQRIEYRIGVNLGDIIVDDDDIFGDGVNVAARLQEDAAPGGIAISDIVEGQIRDRLEVTFIDDGLREFKNIARPVHVWRWLPETSIAGDGGMPLEQPLSLPDKPSIVVLPFDNMSGDPAQEYFSDGISEDLTTALSRFDSLFVIARNSAFTYKGEAIDVKQVGRELGVRYVLEGSVRRAGDRVRVNAQLIDAESDRHVWADRFDREIADVFELQDNIVASIAATVGPEITLAEAERVRDKRPETFDSWDYYLRAVAAQHKMTNTDVAEAIRLLERAIEIEPEFANAYAHLAICHNHAGVHGWVRPVRDAYQKARSYAEEAVRLAPTSPQANQALAFVLVTTGQAEQAKTAARRALELNPNYAEASAVLGQALVFCGELDEGLAACLRAARSNPRDTRGNWLYDAMGHAYFMLGDYEQAIAVSKKGVHQDPSLVGAWVTLAASNAVLGNGAEAQKYVDCLLELVPRYSLRALRKNPMFVDAQLIDKLVESMQLAGLPE
jgi:TolB-like protein/class 3 adenylate cyclase/Tfp pilus assembly protein PilF